SPTATITISPPHPSPTRRSSDLQRGRCRTPTCGSNTKPLAVIFCSKTLRMLLALFTGFGGSRSNHAKNSPTRRSHSSPATPICRSEEHTSELQSPDHIVCPLLLS